MEQNDRLSTITRAYARGEEVAEAAHELRLQLRWKVKKGSDEREAALAEMLEEIRLAMAPIRAEIGRLPYEPQPDEQERALRDVSRSLQAERRQLKRMRRA